MAKSPTQLAKLVVDCSVLKSTRAVLKMILLCQCLPVPTMYIYCVSVVPSDVRLLPHWPHIVAEPLRHSTTRLLLPQTPDPPPFFFGGESASEFRIEEEHLLARPSVVKGKKFCQIKNVYGCFSPTWAKEFFRKILARKQRSKPERARSLDCSSLGRQKHLKLDTFYRNTWDNPKKKNK